MILCLLGAILYHSLKNKYSSGGSVFRWVNDSGNSLCVEGRVLSKNTEIPIAGALVVVTSPSGDNSGYTNENGDYWIEVGEYEITQLKVKSALMKKRLSCQYGLHVDIHVAE